MKVTDEVYALEATRGNYAYVILGPTVTLIDTGRPGQGQKTLDELGTLNVQPKDVRNILLTHHDIDHIGSAAFLQRVTGATVWVSTIDLPYVLGQKPRHGIKRFVSLLMRADIPHPIREYPPENEVDGVKIIPTPGHTPGHVCLLYKDVLFAGDLVFGKKDGLGLSPAIMTWDTNQVKESAKKLASLPFTWVCPAHGAPIKRESHWEQFI